MKFETDLDTIQNLLVAKNWPELRQFLAPVAPEEPTTVFDHFPPSDQVLLFRCLGLEQAADLFSLLDEERQVQLLSKLTDQETRDVVANMSPDDRTFLLEEMPAQVTQQLLNFLSPEDRKKSLQLLGYPEGSVGRLMSPDFATVTTDMLIREAMATIKKQAADSETLTMIYVTDEKGRLLEDIRLRRLIAADDQAAVSSLMDQRYTALSAFEPQEAVKAMKKTGYFALPVVDSDGILPGVVTADNVLDVAVEEATEDFHKGWSLSRWRPTTSRRP